MLYFVTIVIAFSLMGSLLELKIYMQGKTADKSETRIFESKNSSCPTRVKSYSHGKNLIWSTRAMKETVPCIQVFVMKHQDMTKYIPGPEH